MINRLKKEWLAIAKEYNTDISLLESLFITIQSEYTKKSRYYHNLFHINNMLIQAEVYKENILDFETLKFSIWYHDIIYKPSKNDNEEKSAIVAENNLELLGLNKEKREKVKSMIISTKKHQLILNDNSDNAYMLDLDLSILGTDWVTYKKYIENIRKEYKMYPNFMYNQGRKKVLKSFLNRDTLYFTEVVKTKLENQARENIKREIELL